jgi:hypothetical protein
MNDNNIRNKIEHYYEKIEEIKELKDEFIKEGIYKQPENKKFNKNLNINDIQNNIILTESLSNSSNFNNNNFSNNSNDELNVKFMNEIYDIEIYYEKIMNEIKLNFKKEKENLIFQHKNQIISQKQIFFESIENKFKFSKNLIELKSKENFALNNNDLEKVNYYKKIIEKIEKEEIEKFKEKCVKKLNNIMINLNEKQKKEIKKLEEKFNKEIKIIEIKKEKEINIIKQKYKNKLIKNRKKNYSISFNNNDKDYNKLRNSNYKIRSCSTEASNEK